MNAMPTFATRLLRLQQRQQELRALLAAGAATPLADAEAPPDCHEVRDFKDLAAEDERAALRDLRLAQARRDLFEVAAALRRMETGSYGECEACGEPIDERRLQALPASIFCTACQERHERGGPLNPQAGARARPAHMPCK